MNSLVAFAAFRLWRSVGKRRGASSATVEECDATKFHSSTAAGRVIIATAQFQAAMPVFPVRKIKRGAVAGVPSTIYLISKILRRLVYENNCLPIFFACMLFPLLFFARSGAQNNPDSLLPVRGFCIEAPRPSGVDSFVTFINNELAPRKVNTLVLRIDFNYQFKSHPELRDTIALSLQDVKKW